MKKFTTKLLMSIIAVAFAFVALGTSTYAWFSMNTEVTVTGMQVVAKSDNTYLLIGDGENNTAAKIQGLETAVTVDLAISDDDSKVYPSAPKTADDIGEGKKFADGTAVTDATSAAAFANWYTANAEKSSEATMKAGTAKSLTKFDGYVLVKTVYLTVAKGANPAKALTATATFAQKGEGNDLSAARVLVTTDLGAGGMAVLSSTNASNVAIAPADAEITENTLVTVNLYIYVDGNDSKIFTNNTANLKGATISLAFNVSSVPAA